MYNIIIRNRKEEFKELVLYTFFGNMTFVISIGSYAIFNVIFGINELIANALAWVFAVLFSYVTNKKWVFKVATPTKTAFLVQMFAFFSGRFITRYLFLKIARCGIFNKIIRTIIVCVWYNKA